MFRITVATLFSLGFPMSLEKPLQQHMGHGYTDTHTQISLRKGKTGAEMQLDEAPPKVVHGFTRFPAF